MEQLTKNQAVATSQEAVQNQNEPQLRDENAHNDKSVHGVLNPTYQAGLRRDAVQPDIEAERKKRDEIEDRKSGSAGMPRPISYAVFCLKKKTRKADEEPRTDPEHGGREHGWVLTSANGTVPSHGEAAPSTHN